MKTKILGLLAVGLLVGTTGAHAALVTTANFTGSNFTNVTGVYTTSDYISGTFTFGGGLAANSAYDLTPTAFSITDQHQTISTWSVGDEFKLWTDGAGNIVNWRLNFYGSGGTTYITSINAPGGACPQDAALLGASSFAFNGANCVGYVPGTWGVRTVDTGPGPSVPEPGTLVLLGLGLAGLGLSRRRKAD